MNDDLNIPDSILEAVEEKEEEWEKGLTPIERFEKLILHGQVGKLTQNAFFRSLDKAGQVDALCQALDNLIHQLDKMAQILLKASSTHPEGVKINRIAANLVRVKSKLLDDFVKGIDVVAEISHKAKGEQQF